MFVEVPLDGIHFDAEFMLALRAEINAACNPASRASNSPRPRAGRGKSPDEQTIQWRTQWTRSAGRKQRILSWGSWLLGRGSSGFETSEVRARNARFLRGINRQTRLRYLVRYTGPEHRSFNHEWTRIDANEIERASRLGVSPSPYFSRSACLRRRSSAYAIRFQRFSIENTG